MDSDYYTDVYHEVPFVTYTGHPELLVQGRHMARMGGGEEKHTEFWG